MKEWYCKVNETPGKQEGGTMREIMEQEQQDALREPMKSIRVLSKEEAQREELREKIARIIWADGTSDDHGWNRLTPNQTNMCYRVADQILAVLEPQMLTLEEARELLHCWKNESASRYGSVNRQAPLYLKLKGMVEGQ